MMHTCVYAYMHTFEQISVFVYIPYTQVMNIVKLPIGQIHIIFPPVLCEILNVSIT